MDAPVLLEKLHKRGYLARVVKIERVAELESVISKLNAQGMFNPQFYQRELAHYLNFDYKSILPGARSVIVMAAPQPPVYVNFGSHSVVIPPTYVYRDIWEGTLAALNGLLTPQGFKTARARLPLKTLAVRSGLGHYGRNNICYVPGMGSCHRLGAFYSDMPCDSDDWGEPHVMKLCQSCTLCLENCPTHCIRSERFLIDAGNCITYYNEYEDAFPGWLKPEWHNALLGCLVCQKVCPLNKAFMDKATTPEEVFTEEETREILGKTPLSELSPETQAKLYRLCLSDSDVYPLVARNLSFLLRQKTQDT